MRITKYLLTACLFFFTWAILNSQIITLNPTVANGDQSIEIIFDATAGNKELVGASKVYMHHGVITDGPNGTAWKYVKGNWGKDDGIGLMTPVSGQSNKWSIKFNPNVRSYFGVPDIESIYRISCVFRNADGSKKGTIAAGDYGWGTVASNLDFYINLNGKQYVTIINPTSSEVYVNASETVNITAQASANVTFMRILLDEGNGFEEKTSIANGKDISTIYKPTVSQEVKIKVEATIAGQSVSTEKIVSYIVRTPTVIAEPPAGLKNGVNYDENDSSKAILVLTAPQKEFIYVVGDFTAWRIESQYQMKRSSDGETYWLEINDLDPTKEYTYQYWIDGQIKIADPYTEKVADPWNDKFIEPSVYPNPINYNKTQYGIASTMHTRPSQYNWSNNESSWQRPDVNHLVIYELLIRDFVKSHSYKDVIDSLPYLKRLGINAIELMPVGEFEGNDSWGYNTSFWFALDKYYGTKNDLKALIDAAHQQGIAVIMDIVLNHTYSQSPFLQMYFDGSVNKPALNNPWYNRDYVGQYQWGYDINHESDYTKKLIDNVNAHWLKEYHFDGFRFDFTKGFTNYAPNNNVDGFDQSRINILTRMSTELWKIDAQAYVILEHWAPANEESLLAAKGMKMWRNKSYDFVPAAVGNITGTFNGTDVTSHVALFDSHDEERICRHMLNIGASKDGYDIKNTSVMLERAKMNAAFFYLNPGPKLLWMFDELGYDVSIDFNGRLGRKPYPWGAGNLGYYENELRQHIYTVYSGILNVRNIIGPQKLLTATKKHQLTGDTRRLSYDTDGIDLVVIGNFNTSQKSIAGQFAKTGWWFDYFSGDSINVTNLAQNIQLKAGEWRLYTSIKLSEGIENAVAVYSNPVTITPANFSTDDEITITFDAKLASPKNSNGLVGAQKVYMQSGLILGSSTSTALTNNIGTGQDDGIGVMSSIGNDKWQLKIIPREYYGVNAQEEIAKMGMYFRDADNDNFGYGFRDEVIFFNVKSIEPIVTISPAAFNENTEITITFDAKKGNRELIGATKVYMHSGVGSINTTNPQSTAWSNVVGNWGLDDGIGLMTKVPGEVDKWQIKLKPKQHYNLADGKFPYWIAAVFRNENGSKKGTGEPGTFAQGFIADNFDFFLKNDGTVSIDEEDFYPTFIMPNPVSDKLYLNGIDQNQVVKIYSVNGQLQFSTLITNTNYVDVSSLQNGVYQIQFNVEGKAMIRRFVKVE